LLIFVNKIEKGVNCIKFFWETDVNMQRSLIWYIIDRLLKLIIKNVQRLMSE
jgi:hypothetical protein